MKARQFLILKGRSAHFAASLFYLLDVIRSILLYSWRRYDYVIFVRYLLGTAYLPSPMHKIAYQFFASTVPTPELMFFLDVKPEEAYRRILQMRNKLEMFESMEELQRVRCKALSLTLMGRWTIIDANKSIKEVEKEIQRQLHMKI